MKKLFLSMMALCAATSMFAFAQKDSTVFCGEYVQIVATPKEGQHFVKWADNESTDSVRTIYVDGDMEFHAIFQVDSFLIKWVNYDGTFLYKDSVEYAYMPVYGGETPTKPATQQYTYTFKDWGDGTTCNGMENAKRDTTYIAMYDSVVNRYILEYAVDPTFTGSISGTVTYNSVDTVADSGKAYYYGSSVNLKVEKDDACYKFVGWYTQDGTLVSEEEEYTFVMYDNVSLIAKFERIKYTVKVIADPADKGDVDIVAPTTTPEP